MEWVRLLTNDRGANIVYDSVGSDTCLAARVRRGHLVAAQALMGREKSASRAS